MSYYCGFNLEKDHLYLYDDSSHLAYIGASKIKNTMIEVTLERFKNNNTNYFEIDKKTFNEFLQLNQYRAIDMIKQKNKEFINKYNIEEWLI